MAINDTLVTIKDYFLEWHRNNYHALHDDFTTNVITNQSPNNTLPIQSGAVYDCLHQMKQKDNDLQNAVDQCCSTANNKLDKDTESALEVDDINLLYYASEETRGTYPTNFPKNKCTNGAFTWRDKAELMSLGKWYYCTNPTPSFNGTGTYTFKTIPEDARIYVNPSLRLAFCYITKRNIPSSKWNSDGEYVFSQVDKNDMQSWNNAESRAFMQQIAPVGQIWAGTNLTYIHCGVGTDGTFRFRSSQKITKSHDIFTTLFWFYRDDSSYGRWRKI